MSKFKVYSILTILGAIIIVVSVNSIMKTAANMVGKEASIFDLPYDLIIAIVVLGVVAMFANSLLAKK